MRVLAIEPYYGGSHKAFIDGWIRHSRHHWTLLTLPPSWWKWRMRHASYTLADEAVIPQHAAQAWDIIVCSDMLNLPEFRGLACEEVRNLPAITYFHENQWTYPTRVSQERDQHYGFTNFATALASQAVWFNSQFNLARFLAATTSFLRRMPDFKSLEKVELIQAKAEVQPPGIESVTANVSDQAEVPHLLWAARWEHDKAPDVFFEAVEQLVQRGYAFKLSVLGESFREVPDCFEWARKRFADRIVDWGFLPSRRDYLSTLQAADIFVSTAEHEFFGISTVEAVASGALPVVPNRLAYPEVLGQNAAQLSPSCHYDGGATELADRLALFLDQWSSAGRYQVQRQQLADDMQKYFWETRAPAMDARLEQVVRPTTQSLNRNQES